MPVRYVRLLVVALSILLMIGTHEVTAHPGSMAFWHVQIDNATARSRILVPMIDIGSRLTGMGDADTPGEPYVERRLAMARVLLDHFALTVDDERVGAEVVSAEMLPSGMLEVIAHHDLSRVAGTIALRTTFHEFTDDSHRVMARLDQHGSTARLVFTFATPVHVLPGVLALAPLDPSGSVRTMFALGVEHIVTGWDHLVFLLCLLVPGGTLRSRAVMVTAFTVAHSLTLLLAALQVVTLPGRFVEAAIAVSIAYVAIDNMVHDGPRSRWPIAFGFGLVHGFGFAGVLPVQDLPMREFVSSVLAFNLGVEIGQLAIVAVAVPVIMLVARQQRRHRMLVRASSVAVCAIAAFWIVERLQ